MDRLKPAFAPEWVALAALAMLDAVWARAIGFHLTLSWGDGKLVAAGIAVMLALKIFAQPRFAKGGVMAEYFSLTTAAALVFAVLSYLSLASSRALVDAPLMAADRALGFDWMAGYHFLKASPAIALMLKFAYESMVYQGLYFCVLFALMDDRRNLRDMFWLVLVTGLVTSAGVLLFPAFGPFKALNMAPAGSFLPEMEHIKSGHDLNFALARMTGVVSFPSFHTSMALAYVWGFRKTGPIFWAIAALNALMLLSIPWYGGHYLVDMIGGALSMLAALALVRGAPALWTRLTAPILQPTLANR